MKNWQKRKLRDEVCALVPMVVAIVIAVIKMFEICPIVSLVAFGVAVVCFFIFMDVRNKDYRPNRKKAR